MERIDFKDNNAALSGCVNPYENEKVVVVSDETNNCIWY